MPDWICSYCGAPAKMAQGDTYCCARCHPWHTALMDGPQLCNLYPPPTIWERLWGYVMYRAICLLIPFWRARWIVDERYKGTLRQRFAIWVYGGSYWWAERAAGRV